MGLILRLHFSGLYSPIPSIISCKKIYLLKNFNNLFVKYLITMTVGAAKLHTIISQECILLSSRAANCVTKPRHSTNNVKLLIQYSHYHIFMSSHRLQIYKSIFKVQCALPVQQAASRLTSSVLTN